jgi:putative membrane protein
MGIGVILGGIIFLKLIQYCIKHFFSQSYYTIIGFVLGSIIVLYPGFEFSLSGIISIAIFAVCFFIGTTVGEAKN